MLPLYNVVSHMPESRSVRVSTQAVRDHDVSHFHDIIQLVFVFSGELRHVIDGKEYLQTAGSCAFLLPYRGHELDTKVSGDTPVIAHVWFRESFFTDAGIPFLSITDAAHFEGKKIPEVFDFGEDSDAAKALMRCMVKEFDKNRDMSVDVMRDSLAELFRLACHDVREKKASSLLKARNESVERAISYIKEHYPEKIDTDTLSGIAGMSRRSFTSHFRAITNMSPNEFLISVRLSKAVIYLSRDILRDDIARKCGLFDHSNLARCFRKYLGVSPTEFNTFRLHNINVPEQKARSERYPFLAEELDAKK